MWTTMSTNVEGDSFVATVQEGVDRVIESSDEHPWAFITESATLDYYAGQRCDLEVVEDPYTALVGQALAFPLGSTYYDRVNLALLELIEVGQISSLRRKWWPTTECRHAATSGATRLVSPLLYLLSAVIVHRFTSKTSD